MSTSIQSSSHPMLLVRAQDAGNATYTLEEAARLAGMHPALLGHYCKIGVLGPSMADAKGAPEFDDDALYDLLRFEHYRRHHGLRRSTARLICSLLDEVDRLRAELRFQRGA